MSSQPSVKDLQQKFEQLITSPPEEVAALIAPCLSEGELRELTQVDLATSLRAFAHIRTCSDCADKVVFLPFSEINFTVRQLATFGVLGDFAEHMDYLDLFHKLTLGSITYVGRTALVRLVLHAHDTPSRRERHAEKLRMLIMYPSEDMDDEPSMERLSTLTGPGSLYCSVFDTIA